jgi:divalent metal cation (Fe/Co/Zn/Cd) transporter
MAIGGLLIVTAMFLANETRSLLTGESASRRVLGAVREILERDRRVTAVDEILSMHLGPEEVLLAITLDLDDGLPGGAVEEVAAELTRRIEAEVPIVSRVFLRPLLRPDRNDDEARQRSSRLAVDMAETAGPSRSRCSTAERR